MNPGRIGSPSVHVPSPVEEKKTDTPAAKTDAQPEAKTSGTPTPPRQHQMSARVGNQLRKAWTDSKKAIIQNLPEIAAQLAPYAGHALEKAALATPQGRVAGTLLKGASVAVQFAPHIISFANKYAFSKDPAERKKMEEELERNPEMGEESTGPNMKLKDEVAFSKQITPPGFH